MVEAEIPFLYWERTLKRWNSQLETKNKILEIYINGTNKRFMIIIARRNEFGIKIDKMSRLEIEILN